MYVSLREYLLDELDLTENKNLSNISKFIRSQTKLEDFEKCECYVCKVKNKKIFTNNKEADYVYNHHVMKVEFLAILCDKFNFCFLNDASSEEHNSKYKDYKFLEGFEIHSPRIAVCHEHHTMFHELVGDNQIEKIKDIDINHAKNIVLAFEMFDNQVNKSFSNTPKGNVKEYANVNVADELIDMSNVYKYDEVIEMIDKITYDLMEDDENLGIKLPTVDVFTMEELVMFENELESVKFIDKTIVTYGSNINDDSSLTEIGKALEKMAELELIEEILEDDINSRRSKIEEIEIDA